MLLTMEDVVACLGFTSTDSPLARVAEFPEIVSAMELLAEKRGADSITPEQKVAADKLMEIVVEVDEGAAGLQGPLEVGTLGAAEAASQLLAMVAADDSKNPHLLHVDKWISTCCTVLRRCQPGEHSGPWSEATVVCAASCLADLANNPRSTIVCSTRASEIFQSLQAALLIPRVDNRMIFFQACRGLAEILHPSTWPMNERARVPRRLIDTIVMLLNLPPQASPRVVGTPRGTHATAEGPSADGAAVPAEGSDAGMEGAEGKGPGGGEVPGRLVAGAEAPEHEGRIGGISECGEVQNAGDRSADAEEGEEGEEGEGAEGEEEHVTQEDLIHTQACKVVQFMATSGAARLLMEVQPGMAKALEALRQSAQVAEVALQADSAIMSLWLAAEAFEASDPKLRPQIAESMLRALGDEELVDNHQDCSLALVTATMNPVKALREEALRLFGRTLQAHPELVRILIGHIEDRESLAHQSVVYFVLHLLEADGTPLPALVSTPENAALLVPALVCTACTERHYAPITALVRLVYDPVSRAAVKALLTKSELQKLRSIPGGRIQKEVESLVKALQATDRDPSVVTPPVEPIDAAAAYREDPNLQSMFFRKLVVAQSRKPTTFKRTKSADDAKDTEAGNAGSSSVQSVV